LVRGCSFRASPVSGEPRFGGAPLNDPISWSCGFTRWYNEADARIWDQAFR
jgi:hypothetical protein